MTTALVALGANLSFEGRAPQEVLMSALQEFAHYGHEIDKVSRFYRTAAFPVGSGPDYVNAAALVRTSKDCDLSSLMADMHKIEAKFGRKRLQRWSGRTLDLDLIGVGDSVLPDPEGFDYWYKLPLGQQVKEAPQQLILPHPRLQDRAFVLVPLSDFAADWRHPVLGKTVAQMLEALPQEARDEVKPL